MPATAIDIGTYAVKIVTADPGPTPNVIRAVEALNPYNVAVPTDDLQTEQLSELINNLIFDNKLPHTDLRLSQRQSLADQPGILVPGVVQLEVAELIGWQAEQ